MPAPFQPELFEAARTTHLLGRVCHFLPECDSTNTLLARLARGGAPDGALAVTDLQTAGRGRAGRTWSAPARAGLLFSILLRPQEEPATPAQMLMAAGLGAAEGIRRGTGAPAFLKWPNDILLNGRKAGGMLAEAVWEEGSPACLVIGIGVNVNFDPAGVDGIPPDATSLLRETGKETARESLLAAILEEMEARYRKIRAGGTLTAEWAFRLATLGRRVRVETPGGMIAGTALRAEEDGALVVLEEDGGERRILAGDVIHLREK